jgi:hypothetical protein
MQTDLVICLTKSRAKESIWLALIGNFGLFIAIALLPKKINPVLPSDKLYHSFPVQSKEFSSKSSPKYSNG